MIGFRVDANKTIATGHVMRCMTIADALVSLGAEVKFFVADEESAKFVNDRDFAYEVLNSDWKNPVTELAVLAEKMADNDIKVLVCDSYSFNKDYFATLKDKTDGNVKIVAIDDLYAESYPVDVLINYNAYALSLGYENTYDEKVNMLLGPLYAPLRPQFSKEYKKEKYGQKQVLVASGGSDPYGVCLAFVKEVVERRELDDVDFHIIIGSQSDDREITRLAWCSQNVFLHKNVSDMAGVMSGCDVAVSAAGTMLTELCAMKVPAIEYVMADNQKQNSDYYSGQGLMIYGGDVREGTDSAVKHMVDELVEIVFDDLKLKAMRDRLIGICDGQGAMRIAKEILMG